MTIKIGDKIPQVTLMHMSGAGPTPIGTDELFGGKTIALFAVPGAFTPTCSNQHLPGFIAQAAAFADKGVDMVVCLSVNDAFVMQAWGEASAAGDKVKMIADGNGELTEKMGLAMDGSGFGMGKRSQRYSMLVRDGEVIQLNIETQPGLAEESGAASLLAQL